MREVVENLKHLSNRSRIDCNDKDIVEKVWIADSKNITGPNLYSGCYIKRWYHYEPKLRLMTTDKVVNIQKSV